MSTLETLPPNMDVDTERVGGSEAPVPTPPQQPVAAQVLPAAPAHLTPEMIQELVKSGQLVIPTPPVAPAEPRAVVTQPAQPAPRERPFEAQGQPAQPVPPKEPLQPAPPQQPLEVPAQPVPPQQPLQEAARPVPPEQPLVPEVEGQQLATAKQSPEVQGQPAQPLELLNRARLCPRSKQKVNLL